MADVEAIPAGVGEHIEDEILAGFRPEIRIAGVGSSEGIYLHPMFLPSGFEFSKGIVLAGKGHLVGTLDHHETRKPRIRQAALFRKAQDSFGHPKPP